MRPAASRKGGRHRRPRKTDAREPAWYDGMRQVGVGDDLQKLGRKMSRRQRGLGTVVLAAVVDMQEEVAAC